MGILDAINAFLTKSGIAGMTPLHAILISIGLLLIYLAIAKKVEPLLLIGIGTGMVLANIPFAHLTFPGNPKLGTPPGPLFVIYKMFIENELVPLLIFLGLGALTDFRPLIAQPYTFLLGAAAQLGVFVAMLGALFMGFNLNEAASIGIIGGADGPTTIYTAVQLAPYILGPVALAAYTYMALVPIIQPPIIRLLPKKHRAVKMKPPREVHPLEALLFPIVLLVIASLLVPRATPIIGMIALGNLFRESGVTEVVERLSKTAANELMNILTILLSVTVGATMSVDIINYYSTITGMTPAEFLIKFALIFIWGLLAFTISTFGGIILGEVMYFITRGKVNPIIGAAGVSAVPMSARVCQKEAQLVDPSNYIIMNAMGPNVAGVIGTAVAAGVYIEYVLTFYEVHLGVIPWRLH